ncbi:Piso0_002638 [Millerozyma farinosa CBS 7064]|uniref:UDP-N-acetylglucosamine transferase subunit ALG14 n=1 Tax=Pichia sorbitophila (strain ATCC MYA-4447 / BCRC 22081 / CBS 7064 / NBRC 10061 / NRRL Y-12695) TaxID=559304 RepID=G8YD51_PICSO|nr:Piso0_002638 [Millerozyma farinosa CBS 7064]
MYDERIICYASVAVLIPILCLLTRLAYILPAANNPSNSGVSDITSIIDGKKNVNIMILLGSGGHTGEMLRLIESIEWKYFTRTWVLSSTDKSSLSKVQEVERSLLTAKKEEPKYLMVPRARNINEGLLSSIKSTLISFISISLAIIRLPVLPSILLLNGPGTSVPLAYFIFLLKFLGLCKTRIVFIESLARVNSLSLSGILLLPISDRFIVQWPYLSQKYKRAEYYGILV